MSEAPTPTPNAQPQAAADEATESSKEASPEKADEGGKDTAAPAPAKAPSTVRLSYKGQPGEDGFKRRVEIIQAMMVYPPDTCFGIKEKGKAYKEVVAKLNKEPLFGGAMKENTLREKWSDMIKVVDKIISEGESSYIMQAQNGGTEMNELDALHLSLAKQKYAWATAKSTEKEELAAADAEAENNLKAAMSTVSKRFDKYDGASTFAEAASESMKTPDKGKSGAGSKRTTPDSKGSAEKKEGEEEDDDENEKGEKDLGRGTSKGAQKRAKGDPALNLDRDPTELIGETNDSLLDYLSASLEHDKELLKERTQMECDNNSQVAEAAKMNAEAAKMNAEAAKIAAESKKEKSRAMLMQANAAMLQAFITASEKGIALPPALAAQMQMPSE